MNTTLIKLTAFLALVLTACPTVTQPSPPAPPPPSSSPPPPSSPPPAVTQLVVSQTAGSDANPGNPASPLKTLRKALALAQKGQTIKMLHGTYDATNGEAFPETVPDGVSVLADNPRDIVLVGKSSQDGLVFAGSGGAAGLDLQGFDTAITATAGTLAFDNLALSGNATGLKLSASANVSLTGKSSIKDGQAAVRLSDNAGLSMTGGLISGMKGAGGLADLSGLVGGFFCTGSSTLELSGVTLKDNPVRWTVYLRDSANASIKSGSFTGNGILNGSGAVIESVGSGTLSIEDTSLFLNNADGLDVSSGTVTIKGGEISAGKDYGMNIYGANATVSVDGTRINGNTDIGVRFDRGTLEISNAEIRGNTTYGITFFNQGGPSSLKMRNTQVMNNPSVGVYISTSDLASQADLGTAADPGQNTLQSNGTNLDAGGKVNVNASGNVWQPNQQGADAAGRYATGTPIAGPTSGTTKNIKVASGITVQL